MPLKHLAISTFAFTLALAGCSGDDDTTSDSQGSSDSTSAGTTGTTEATTTSESASASSGTGSSSSASSTTATTGGTATTTTDGTATDATTADTTAADTTSGDPTTTTTGDPTTTTTGDLTTSGTTGAIDSCDDFYPVFQAEVAEIRGCESPKECGVEIKGTSCGCTRNWVARLDADLSEFEALVELAIEMECELPFFSTCDCPATDGFTCTDGICNWNYI